VPSPQPAPPSPAGRVDGTLRGILLILTGYLFIAFSDAAVKWVVPQVGTGAAMMWRGIFGAITMAVVARATYRGVSLRPVNVRLITTRSLLHCVVTVAFYVAWAHGLPLAETYALSSVSPLIMTLLAIPLLGEVVGWRRWVSTLVGFSGVMVMLQPGGSLWNWQAAALLAAVALMALTRLWTRILARTDAPVVITFWLMVAHIPTGLLLMPAFPPPGAFIPSAGVALALLWIGCGNALAHFFFARAFASAPVSVLAPFEYSPLIWGLPIGLVIWGDWPAPATFAGAGIIIAAGLYNLHREQMRARQARLGKVAA
jgi:drug/metabolite transporter (DMT)-like permease